jgi:rRNA pseudouridine-1189 N-methylase Emg1 (Nep1/Mra1 family)
MKFLIALIAMSPIFIFAQNSEVISLNKSEVEAVQAQDGTYARFLDISEGFVKFSGIRTKDEALLIDLKKSSLNSIILQDGTHLNKAILNHAAAVIGGDMGGGGTAH